MLQRQRISDSLLGLGGRRVSRAAGERGPSRALRLSLGLLLLLSLVLVGLGIARGLSPFRLANALQQTVSETWTRLLAATPWAPAARQSAGANAVRERAVAVTQAPLVVSKVGEADVLTYGDRLKITFFESLGVAVDDSSANADHLVAAVFPRMDLSGDYEVDEGGGVNIPKLGRLAVAGQDVAALQAGLAAAFERVIGRKSDVHVAIVERQPIYVLGTVRNAGSFKFAPGMTVLQALADAGGIDFGDTSRAIENTRETERLRQTEDKLDRLLVKQAMLIARRDNSAGIVVTESIRSRPSRTNRADRLDALITGATATLRAARENYQEQLSLARRQVEVARTEVDAQAIRANQLKDLLAKKQERFHGLEGIAANGSVSRYKLSDMSVDIAELVARQEDVRVASAQAERRLVEAQIAAARVEREYPAETEKELAATQEEIDDCSRAITSMRAVTQILGNSLSKVSSGPTSVQSLMITRRAAAGLTIFAAADTTVLLPGDVVQVNSTIVPKR